MVIGAKYLTYAKYVSGGDGTALVYAGGKVDYDKVVRVEENEERSDESMYYDDHLGEHDNTKTKETVNFELADIDDDMKEDFLGMANTESDLISTATESPFIGVGYIRSHLYHGVKTYEGRWYAKVQFGLGSQSFNTKGENTEFQTHTIEGTAVAVRETEEETPKFHFESKRLGTEAAALAWLKGHANVQ